MKIIHWNVLSIPKSQLFKTFLCMKLTLLSVLIFSLQISAKVHSQNITLNVRNAPLSRIFLEIEKRTPYRVVFSDDAVSEKKLFSVKANNEDVKDILKDLLNKTNLTFKLLPDNLLVITYKNEQQQNITVTGKVVDEAGEPLIGVSISQKGTTTGTVTDLNGNFQINVANEQAVLVFRYISFETVERTVGNQRVINLTMTVDTRSLDEVVVTGYGTQRRGDITGAISSIKPEDLENVPVPSVDALLQGRAAGVQVTTNSGAPGGGVSVRVRGNTSISSGNDPLYVIDGIPIVADDLSGGSGLSTNGQINAMADINPNDIESIQILKDASATAIYGARAANGVVLITTKRGTKGQTRYSFNNYAGFVQAPRKLPLLNGEESKTLFLERRYNAGENAATNFPQLLDNPSRTDFQLYNNNTDWQNEVLRSSVMQNYSLGMQGGDEKTRYAISLGYLDQEGHIIETKYNRITSRINVDYEASKKLRFGNSLAFTRSKTNLMDQSTGTRLQGFSDPNPYFSALVKSPFLPVFTKEQDGTPTSEYFGLVRDFQDVINPVGVARQLVNDAFNNRAIGNIYGEYDVIKGLKFRSTFSIDYFNLKEKRFVPAANREASAQNTQEFNWINENTLTYSTIFNEKHNVSALIGNSIQESRRERLRSRGQNSPSDLLSDLNSAPVLVDGFSIAETWGISSLFARVTYSFSDKYLFTGNVRRDGSSRFGENNKFALFPSASFGWRISSEPFMQNVTFLNDLKLRASYGSTGNQNIGNYRSKVLYSGGSNYLGNGGIAPSNIGVPDLSWESTRQANIGLDISLLNDRLTFITDYYIKKTNDLLLSVPLPSSAGFGSSLQNFGDVENKGFEFTAIGRVFTGAFKWNVDLNLSTNRNKILRLPGASEIIRNFSGLFGIAKEGEAIGTFYGWNMLGVYARDEDNVARDAQGNIMLEDDGKTPKAIRNNNINGAKFTGGDVIFEDVNHDGVINDDDRVVIGKAFPDFYGGFNNNFSFKNWDLNVFFQFSKGNDVINGTRRSLESMSNSNNSTVNTLRRWRKQGDVTDVPKAINGDPLGNTRQSTRWVEDGSYFRFKTVTLGYNLPPKVFGKSVFRNAKIYVTGQNLLTFTNYLGIDPEVNALNDPLLAGIDIGTYPQSRTIIMGINLGF